MHRGQSRFHFADLQRMRRRRCRLAANAASSMQTRDECGVVDADSRRSQANFMCVACGYAQNADLNAARNILASATGASARRGALGLPTPATREMDTDGVNLCM